MNKSDICNYLANKLIPVQERDIQYPFLLKYRKEEYAKYFETIYGGIFDRSQSEKLKQQLVTFELRLHYGPAKVFRHDVNSSDDIFALYSRIAYCLAEDTLDSGTDYKELSKELLTEFQKFTNNLTENEKNNWNNTISETILNFHYVQGNTECVSRTIAKRIRTLSLNIPLYEPNRGWRDLNLRK